MLDLKYTKNNIINYEERYVELYTDHKTSSLIID